MIGDFWAWKTFLTASLMIEEMFVYHNLEKRKKHPARTREEYRIRNKFKKRYSKYINS
jgi:hypothetical protein